MLKFSKIAMISALMGAVIASTAAFAVSKRTWAAGARDVQNLIRLMDQDKNGVVSKEEFMQFMEAEFDRLDVDRAAVIRGALAFPHLRGHAHKSSSLRTGFSAPRDRCECRAARNAATRSPPAVRRLTCRS